MIAIIDNGEAYSGHSMLFVDVASVEEAEMLVVVLRAVRPYWDAMHLAATADRIEWRKGATSTIEQAIASAGECYMPAMEDDFAAFDAVPVDWLERVARALASTWDATDKAAWSGYVDARRERAA